ncbi:hypothetical protein KBC03_03175 [Patescibacteria group bacterium]|nr:hypothetical protein [Patescibacteria group bacterium]
MPVKSTKRSASSAAKAKKAVVTEGDSTESIIEGVIASKKKTPAKRAAKKTASKAAKKTTEKPTEKKGFTRSYTLSGADVTGKNLVIVESPAKGKTIK